MDDDIKDKYERSVDKLYEAIDELSTSPFKEVDNQLLGVIKNIKNTIEKRKTIPKVVNNPNLNKLISACDEHINTIKDFGRSCKDDKQWIYEEALKAIYGENIFAWINKYDKGY